ncbi:hypothetical protein [Dehalogenimonas sp. 4OHTPN]|uniref:Uncharacterized protein n=1 Tax=Dehalogenimonas sp. 4OHTPN TaxID=3166643 RepID=A0AAU8G6T0_9CHLR
MSEEIGRIERPEAVSFKGKRKLCVVPLIFEWSEAAAEYTALFNRYWEEVSEQLRNLSSRIGPVKYVFHEGADHSGDAAIAHLEKYTPKSHSIVVSLVNSGAVVAHLEDRELVSETLDWERFIMMGFASTKVARMVTENYRSAMKKRYDFMVTRINETIKPDETGVLFLREGYPIQYPSSIEVFSVSPPSLDEINRYLRNHPMELKDREIEPETSADDSTLDGTPASDVTGN